MAYIDPADLRDGTLYPYIDVPASGGGSVSDARLTAMIGAAGNIIDHYCRTSFGTVSGGTVTVQGDGSNVLILPRRVRDVTAVNVLTYDGTSTAFDTTYFRVHSSLATQTGTNEIVDRGGLDWLELLKSLTVGPTGGWPPSPWKIQVVGDWDYGALPEVVKQATATLVWSWCRSDMPPGVDSVDTGAAVFRRPRPGPDTTGLPEVDMLLNAAGLRRVQYGYSASGS